MNSVLQGLRERKSVRAFAERPIGEKEKTAILDAAIQAPTAGNQQLYTILDITDQRLKNALAESCDHQPFIAAAPMVLVFLADCLKWPDAYRYSGMNPRPAGLGDLMLAVSDACIAAQNAVIAAESLGVGSCYIGDVMENAETQRQLLQLPPTVFPCAMLVFGYPTQQQQEREKTARFPMESIVQENRYRRLSAEDWKEMLEKRNARQHPGFEASFQPWAWMQAFCKRKYESDFSREMTRSVAVYLDDFSKG